MSQDAFLVPITSPEFDRTVVSPVDLTNLPIPTSKIEEIDTRKSVRVWGVKNSNLNKNFYDSMTEGDYLLFYQNDHYPYFGRTGHKFNSDVISREYWGNIQADMLYTIKEFKKIDISRKALNEASGYKTNYQPQSIKRMSNKAYRNIRTEYDSVEKLVSNSRRGVESQ